MRGHWFAAAVAIALVATGAVAQEKQKDPGKEKEEGFVPLFNGKDFAGWILTAGPKEADKAWTVKDGIMDVTGKYPGSWLRSEKTYKDFILRLEYKIARNMNSGIFLRALEKGNPAYSGMEIQVHGDDPLRGPSVHGNGALYGAIPPSCNPANLDGWNQFEIELRGMHLIERQNGVTVMDVRLDDPVWNDRLAPAKDQKPTDKTRKLTERAPEGFIGLQNHGSPVQFRTIRIKPL